MSRTSAELYFRRLHRFYRSLGPRGITEARGSRFAVELERPEVSSCMISDWTPIGVARSWSGSLNEDKGVVTKCGKPSDTE